MEWIKIETAYAGIGVQNTEALACNSEGHILYGTLVFSLNCGWKCINFPLEILDITHYCIVELPKEELLCGCVIPKPKDPYHCIDSNICRDCNRQINNE